MSEILDMRPTIVPKSDQINADQLLGGPMTITVTGVTAKAGDQPVTIHYQGDKGRPYKPCLTMRKVLVLAWGHDGNQWPGKSMRLYTDPSVMWGKEEVGGVRISHLSDIAKDIKVSLAATKGKKIMHEIKRLADGDTELIAGIKAAGDLESLKAAFAAAYKSTKAEDRRAAFKAEYDRRSAELAPSTLLQEYVVKMGAAENSDDAAQLLDEARSTLNPTEQAELNKAHAARFGADL